MADHAHNDAQTNVANQAIPAQIFTFSIMYPDPAVNKFGLLIAHWPSAFESNFFHLDNWQIKSQWVIASSNCEI